MKTCLMALLALMSCAWIPATDYKTSVWFNNRTSLGDQPIRLPDGTGPGSNFVAQLLHVQEDGSVIELGRTLFRADPEPARFFVNPIQVTLERFSFSEPTSISGTIRLRLRVWEGPDWTTARVRGQSEDWEQTVFPIDSPYLTPQPTSEATAFRGFTLTERPLLSPLWSAEGMKLKVTSQYPLETTKVSVEQSADLMTWQTLGVFSLVNGELLLPNSVAARNTPRTYFRIKLD